MHWKLTVALVCLFGVLKKFRPGTPFLTPFLESPEFKNFTNGEVNSQIYPFWTYANLISMVPIFACTDFLRFKPILVLEAVALLATWLLLLFGTSLFHMQMMQISFGIATSADIAYFSYLYTVVKREHYKRITSYIRTASMVGKFAAYSLGQLLISTNLGDYLLLNQITMVPAILIVPISLALPMANPTKSLKSAEVSNVEIEQKAEQILAPKGIEEPKLTEAAALLTHKNVENYGQKATTSRLARIYNQIKQKFFSHYKNPLIFRWSLWSILVQCGIYQVTNYIQTLWAYRQVERDQIWNGFVESANTLLSALGIFFLQYIPWEWERHEFAMFVGTSMAIGAMFYAMIHFGNVFVDYVLYLLVYAMFNFLMAISSNLIAINLSSKFYGLVFGLNSFLAVLAQTLLTLVIVDKNGPFRLDIEGQFLAYSAFFFGIAALFIFIHIPNLLKSK